MDEIRTRTPDPYEREKPHRMKRRATDAVNSRHARVVPMSRGGLSKAEIARQGDYSDVQVRGGKGVERHRATCNRLGGVRHMFGAYDMKTRCLFGIFTKGKNGVEFLRFLQWFRRRYRHSGMLFVNGTVLSAQMLPGPSLEIIVQGQ